MTIPADTGRDKGKGGPQRYEDARMLLAKDVNAAVEGAIEGGADDIIVVDGHGGGNFFVMESLHTTDGADSYDLQG